MTLALIIGTMIFKMFIMMSVGMIGSVTKLITEEGNKAMTDVLLFIVTPILILVSYQVDFSKDKLQGLLLAIGLSFLSHIIAMVIASIGVKKKNNTDYQVERMGTIYSNCGFMGIPLLYALFGAEGVFYVTAYLTVFNLFVWSHAVILMTGKVDKKGILSVFKSPNIIAIIIGLILFVTGIRVPELILDPLKTITLVNTPLAMLVIGATLIQSNLLKMITKSRLYYITFLRLVVVPLFLIIAFKILGLTGMVPTIILIATACPVASTGTMFALRFDKNSNYAAGLLSISTLMSIMTIPLMAIISEWIQ
ncbi:AEC family transporter [Fusibacter ferrireducens]|uniref:AEC family transporter n=1 Tax=Fusibacter ferrireducens TaxID=2785058 RepID=A0ABR9ZZI5_9FIRM|nr:AEC family transporter [Fusibacter ferrireducens]MBF4695796.1 AEC family transporter [Fusibacter ferrireducens]